MTQEQRTEGIKRQAQELIEQSYQRGYKAGYAKCEEELAKEAIAEGEQEKWIKQGRNEAWEAAKRISCGTLVGGYSFNDLIKVFGTPVYDNIFTKNTASEAIEKLKAWEKKQEQQEDDKIRVGDEVVYYENSSVKFIVTQVRDNHISGINNTGEFLYRDISHWKKTGRTFPEIAEVLAKMKEKAK